LPHKSAILTFYVFAPAIVDNMTVPIVCSGGTAARAAGRTIARQAEAIPVFIKLETELFRYVGQFAVSESLTAPLDCAPYAHKSGFTVGQVSRVIKMNRC
jgi:hypothetical protein